MSNLWQWIKRVSWTATGTFLNASKPLTWSTKMWSPYLNDSDASSPSLSWAASWYYLCLLYTSGSKKVRASSGVFLWADTVTYRSCTMLLEESVTLSSSMALYSERPPSR